MKSTKHKLLQCSLFILLCLVSISSAQQNDAQRFESIETKPFNLKRCIPLYGQNQYVIDSKKTFLENIRNDAQTENCKEFAESVDFENFNYIGLLIRSGYCRYPKGLEHKFIKDSFAKKYILKISYTDPEGQVCRAASRYEMWLQVPKLQKGFEVSFKVTPKPRNEKKVVN